MFVLMISRLFGTVSLMTYISWSSDFLKFFRLGQFLSKYLSYRVVSGTCEVFVFRLISQQLLLLQPVILSSCIILAWPLECSHLNLTLNSISESIRHATLSYLLI